MIRSSYHARLVDRLMKAGLSMYDTIVVVEIVERLNREEQVSVIPETASQERREYIVKRQGTSVYQGAGE